MKQLACAFTAAIVISAFSASTTAAMSLGSLLRQQPATADTELTTSSIPHACGNVACGAGNRKSVAISPELHTILVPISGFVRSHIRASSAAANG
jgi:hypothetical protein